MNEKLSYAIGIRRLTTKLMEDAEDLMVLYDIYFDRGYNSGGANEIVDGDIIESGITASAIADVITAVAQLSNYMDNASVTTGDYSASYNKTRNL